MDLYGRNQKIRSFFNEKIDSYDDVHNEYIGMKNEASENLDKDARKILDLGAGTGLELIHLFELYPDAEVTVIDITENMLDKLKTRSFSSHVKTICGDFFEVDFGENYDAVISTAALHHFKKEEKMVLYKKIYDCLKENGQFINSDCIALTEEIEQNQLYELENNFDDYKHIDTPLTIEHEREVLEKSGFKEISFSQLEKDDYRLILARK